MNYNIGQIIYVVLSKKNQVYPMRVIEVITKKTLDGEVTQYVLQGGPDPSTTIMMDKLDGEIFTSAAEVQQELTKRATSQIEKLVVLAETKAKEWYGSSHEEPEDLPPFEVKKHAASIEKRRTKNSTPPVEETVSVRMPDGSLAKVKVPVGSTLDLENGTVGS